MGFTLLGDLNWLAVGVATVAYFMLGGIWYLPKVFGDLWSRAMNWETSEEDSPGPALYLVPLATCLVATIAVAMLVEALGIATLADGLGLGLVVGVGIAAAVLFVTGIFDPNKRRPMTWFSVTAGYNVVGLLIVSAILATWR